MKVGTDFSGIGSPEQALKNLNIKHKVLFSCEIDKYARQSYLANHTTNKMYEDITKRNHKEVEQLDLYVAGFPCQAFSVAGKRKGFEDVRGTLFFNVAEFIKENQPKTFILENVKGLLSHDNGRTFQTITDLLSNCGGTANGQISLDFFDDGLGYHIYFKVLNTKKHGLPQNRERIFIVGFKDFRPFNFPKEEVLKLKLKDMLQNEVDNKYFINDYKKLIKINNNYGLLTGGKWDKLNEHPSRVYNDNSIAPSVHTQQGGNTQLKVNLITKTDQVVIQLNESKECGGKQPYQQNRVYDINGINPALNSGQSCWGGNIINTHKIRRLTPLECFRLQGFPDSFKKVVSDTQLYKQAGNSISVPVIQKIIKNVLND